MAPPHLTFLPPSYKVKGFTGPTKALNTPTAPVITFVIKLMHLVFPHNYI